MGCEWPLLPGFASRHNPKALVQATVESSGSSALKGRRYVLNVRAFAGSLIGILCAAVCLAAWPNPVAVLKLYDEADSLFPYVQRDVSMLESLDVAHDLLAPKDLTAEALAGYELLILPTSWAVAQWETRERAAAIRGFVHAGGALLATEAGWGGRLAPQFFPGALVIDTHVPVEGSCEIQAPTHPILTGISNSDLADYADSMVVGHAAPWVVLATITYYPVLLYSEYGAGFAVYSCDQVRRPPESSLSRWYVNTVELALAEER